MTKLSWRHLAIFAGLSLLPCAAPARGQSTRPPAPTEAPADDQNDAGTQGDTNDQQPNDDAKNNPQNSPNSNYPTFPAPFDLQWGEGPEQILKWASSRQFQTAWKDNAQAQGSESHSSCWQRPIP